MPLSAFWSWWSTTHEHPNIPQTDQTSSTSRPYCFYWTPLPPILRDLWSPDTPQQARSWPMPCFLVVLCTSLCDAVAGIHMSSLKSKDLPCPDCLHRTHPVKTQDDFLCLITSPQPTQSSPRLYGCYSTDLPHDAAVMRNPGTSSHNLLKALHTITAFIFLLYWYAPWCHSDVQSFDHHSTTSSKLSTP